MKTIYYNHNLRKSCPRGNPFSCNICKKRLSCDARAKDFNYESQYSESVPEEVNEPSH